MAKEPIQKRVIAGTQDIHHDLYKLEVAKMKKNLSFRTDEENWQEIEHCHFFHSVDSAGRKQFQTNAVGNHYHKVTLVENGDGEVPTITVSPPMKKAKKGKHLIEIEDPNDTHTHKITYKGSQVVKAREVSPEFVKFEAAMAAKKPKPVEGVSE